MLGFSNICKNKSLSCREILEVLSFNSVINSSIIHSIENNDVGRILFPEEITKSVYYSIMSDSIFMATPVNKTGLLYMLQLCSIIQNYLLENEILLRGGIAKGEFYGFEDIAFGPALIDAHYLEGNIAVYPRIVLSNDVMEDITSENDSHINLYINHSKEDSICYVNHLNPLELWRMKNNPDKLTKIHNFIEKGCQNKKPKIRAKHQWLKNYYEQCQKNYSMIFPSEEERKKLIDGFTKYMQERNNGNG